MRPPYSSYQASTRAWNPSRPSSSLVVPSSASCRSMTFWVAIAAWSVPGHHSTSNPAMRRCRQSVSWIENVEAWPMCSAPVMLGGGSAMTYTGLVVATSAWPTSSARQRSRHFGSTLDQSKCFSIGRLSIWADRRLLARRQGFAGLRIAPFGHERRRCIDELQRRAAQVSRGRALADRRKRVRGCGSDRGEILDGSEVGACPTADEEGHEPGHACPTDAALLRLQWDDHRLGLPGVERTHANRCQRGAAVKVGIDRSGGVGRDLGELVGVGRIERLVESTEGSQLCR